MRISEARTKTFGPEKDLRKAREGTPDGTERLPDKSPNCGVEKTPEPRRFEHDFALRMAVPRVPSGHSSLVRGARLL